MKTIRYLLLISLGIILQIVLLNAQEITGKVLDKNNGQGLSFVQIGVANKNLGTLSNENGFFTIKSTQLNDTDTLIFSSISDMKELRNLY